MWEKFKQQKCLYSISFLKGGLTLKRQQFLSHDEQKTELFN